jgi:hypothetical protein
LDHILRGARDNFHYEAQKVSAENGFDAYVLAFGNKNQVLITDLDRESTHFLTSVKPVLSGNPGDMRMESPWIKTDERKAITGIWASKYTIMAMASFYTQKEKAKSRAKRR